MPKHVKTKTKKASEPRAKKKSEPPAPKKSKPAQSYHDVSVPSSEFQQLGSNYQPPKQEGNGQ
jgi:hypothetical protein